MRIRIYELCNDHLPYLVEEFDTLQTSFSGNLLVRFTGSERILDMMRARTTEDDNVKERVRAETVRTMHGHACRLSSCI